jgi:hypothetical protein
MATPEDAVHLALERSEGTVTVRVREDTRLNAAFAVEEPVGDVVDERCSRDEDVGDVAEVEVPAARGGDDALTKSTSRRDVYFDA